MQLQDNLRALLTIGSILFAGVVVVLALFASFRERFDFIIHRILRLLPEKWATRAIGLLDSLFHGLSVLRNPIDALVALLFSILAWLSEAGMYAVLALSFGIVLQFPVFVLATAVANLVTIVPSTPGYIGVFDAPVKAILTLFGAPANTAASFTLLLHATLVLPVVALGLIFVGRLGLSLGQLQKRSEGVAGSR